MLKTHLERVLITGATGTLGYNIVRQLGAHHPESKLLILMRRLDESLFKDIANVEIHQVDMLDTDQVRASVLAFRPNAVIHSAASGVRPSAIGYFDLVDLNVSATVELFRATCEIPDCQ